MRKARMLEEEWQRLLIEVLKQNPLHGCQVITAYNEVIDRICKLSDDDIRRLPQPANERSRTHLRELADFSKALDFSMRNGLALELHAIDDLFETLESMYEFSDRLGGQAAIIGSLISRFSGNPVIIHPDRIDNSLGALLREENILAPVREKDGLGLAPPHEIMSKIKSERHLIFEFCQDQLSITGGTCPRHNRLIVDPMTSIRFDPVFEEMLPALAKKCNVFVVAGLDHMDNGYRDAFERVAAHVRTMRKSNPDLTAHLEITSMSDPQKQRAMMTEVLPHFQSIGLNEAELIALHDTIEGSTIDLDAGLSVDEQLNAMDTILGFGPDRIHMHTLGYYLRIGKTKSVLSSLKALIFSSALASAAALNGTLPYPEDMRSTQLSPSEKGLDVLDSISNRLIHRFDGVEPRRGETEGALCVPTPIIQNPKLTVGLGDCISGACVTAEKLMGAI